MKILSVSLTATVIQIENLQPGEMLKWCFLNHPTCHEMSITGYGSTHKVTIANPQSTGHTISLSRSEDLHVHLTGKGKAIGKPKSVNAHGANI